MMKRDREIIDTVERFRCLSRDHIAQLFYNHCKKPETNANNALKRLRDRKYLTVAPYRQPYVYLTNPAPIKKDSNKIDHYLAIADVYTELLSAGKVRTFDVEPRYDDVEVRPDIFAIFRGAPFFIEVQNSVYSERVMKKKIERYEAFYDEGTWRHFEWQRKGNEVFPYIILLSRNKYRLETEGIQVYQFRDITEFLKSIAN